VSHRPLVLVSGLTLGDYLLWNWSLNSNHDVQALVSGLTLPPLAVACLWLLAMSVMRVIARYGRRPARRGMGIAPELDHPVISPAPAAALEEAASPAAARPTSGKLAA